MHIQTPMNAQSSEYVPKDPNKIGADIQSRYSMYYGLLAPFINLFGEKAIEAYFYGYNTIYTQIEKNEFEFFVIVIENYGAKIQKCIITI